jgi:hypothetical protein
VRKNSSSECLSDQEIAGFIDHKKKYSGYDRVIRHISECDECLNRVLETAKYSRVEEGVAPGAVIKKLFDNAGKIAPAGSLKKLFRNSRVIIPVLAAAVVIAALTVTLFRTEGDKQEAPSRPGIIALSDNRDKVKMMSEDESAMSDAFKKSKPARSLAEDPDGARIKYEKKLLHAGFLAYLMKNGTAPDTRMTTRLKDDLYFAIADVEKAADYVIKGDFESLRSRMKDSPEAWDLFHAGFVLGRIFYHDEFGRVNGEVLTLCDRYLMNTRVDEVRDYVSSLRGDDLKKRELMRKKLKAAMADNR